MKELSIEEKAARYDRSLERARDVHTYYCDDREQLRKIEHIFPELKESEDERIRQKLIDYCDCSHVTDTFNGIPWENVRAWLEKQGEQKPSTDFSDLRTWKYIIDAVLTEKEGIGQYIDSPFTEEIAKKLQKRFGNIEQKPADKVIEEEKPLLEKFKQAVYDCAWGKVTCKKEGESKEEYANRWAEHLLILVRDWADDYIDNKEDVIARRAYDKGKQDIQKPAWSEEDKNMLQSILDEYKSMPTEKRTWLKSLKDRVQPQLKQEWKQENTEELSDFENVMMHIGNSFFGDNAGLDPNDTNAIKEQANLLLELVSSKEWSKEDEVIKKELISYLISKKSRETDGYAIWLKSLKERYTWKPSDEQMFDLKCAADLNRNVLLGQSLLSLYNDLKKLRGK